MNSQFLIPGRRGGENKITHDHGTDGGGRELPLRLSAFTDFALGIGGSLPLMGGKVSPGSEPYVVHKGPNLYS